MPKTREQATQDLLSIVHHLQNAVESSQRLGPDAKIELGILGRYPDGSGTIVASLRADEFLQDLKLALGAPEPTEDQMMDAKARQFLDTHGLSPEE